MKNADIVIIGAGINGVSTAFHLAQQGVKRVVVVERRHLAAGATGKSGALVRMHYTNEPETRLAFESLRYFQHWGEMVGGDCGFRPVGLMVFTAPSQRHHLEANLAMQRAIGVNVQLLTPQEARELDPALNVEDVTQIAYEPDAGYADPNATVYSMAQAAMRLGVTFRFETEVTQLRTQGNCVVGVETSGGRIDAPVVVVTAGAWANPLFTPLGLDLGTKPFVGQVVIFRWALERSPHHLTYIDHISDSWARPIDGNCTLFGTEVTVSGAIDPNQFNEAVSPGYIDYCRSQLARRFPIMRQANVRGNSACVMMSSPDARPIIDQLAPYEGLFTMTACNGTSFKTGPAVGKCLSEWITEGRAKTVDLTAFRASRYAEGKPWHDQHAYTVEPMTISR